MQCPICHTLNRTEARFCKECGHFLAALCPQCRRELPDNAKYCDACGFHLTGAPRAAPLAEAPPSEASIPSPPTRLPPAPAPPRPEPDRQSSAPGSSPGEMTRDAQALIQQYLPKELLKKLNAGVEGGKLAGERRTVTMMFCDVKGSTKAAEQLDPEDWTDLINGAFEHMIRPVYKYEGMVARLMGDGILAFFGAPIAHEDDPERAVLAGLEIVSGLRAYCQDVKSTQGLEIEVRVGINTGMVVVGAVGSDLRMEYTAMGDAINLAARMEQTAEPGTVQITRDTYKLIAPLFEVQELGGISVKGKDEPVPAYRVLARKASAGRVRGIAGLESKLVGRDLEMAALDDIIGKAERGVGHIVSLVSEAGLGKSRLIEEAQRKWKGHPGIDWYALGSLSYESSRVYGMFQNLFRRLLGVVPEDAPAEVRAKMDAHLALLPAVPGGGGAQALAALLGLPPDPALPPLDGDTFKRELFAVVEAVLRRTFARKPGVIVIDDLHWSDSASVELLVSLLPLLDEIPLVLLYAIRPNRDAPAWQVNLTADRDLSHRFTEIKLRPLSVDESRLMVHSFFGDAEIPDDLMDRILERAGGNPFFIEEVVRSLIENGTFARDAVSGHWSVARRGEVLDIPQSLQALLAARIDQLEEMTRRTLQLSAVIGRSFYLRVLERIADGDGEVDRHLDILQRLEMIGEAARLPEVEYRFRNPLTQEVAYQSILLKQRREFHRRVAETIEQLYPERLDEYSSLLEYHYMASDRRDKVIEYARRAARRAVTLYSYDDALRHLQAALDRLPDSVTGPEVELKLRVLEELADVCHLLREFERALTLYQRAHELAQSAADRTHGVRLSRKLIEIVTEAKWSVDAGTYRRMSGLRETSLAGLRELLPRVEAEPPHAETVNLFAALSVDAWRNQRPPNWENAQRLAQAAVDTAERLDDPVVLSHALGALASVLDGRSLLREHLAVALRRVEISRDLAFHDIREQLDALRGVGAALMYVGEYGEALSFLQQAQEIAARIRATDQLANTLGLQAQCHFRSDHWDQVLTTEQRWRELEREYARERVGET